MNQFSQFILLLLLFNCPTNSAFAEGAEIWICRFGPLDRPSYTNVPVRTDSGECQPSSVERAAFNKLPEFPLPVLAPEVVSRLEQEKVKDVKASTEQKPKNKRSKSTHEDVQESPSRKRMTPKFIR